MTTARPKLEVPPKAKKKRRKGSKGTDKHVQRRARQRFGLDLDEHDIDRLIAQIKRNEAQFLGRQSSSRTLWLVEYEGERLKVVYQAKKILTVLKESWPTDAERHEAALARRAARADAAKSGEAP